MEKKDHYRFVIAAIVMLVRFSVGLIWASAGPLLPLIMQEYDISRGTISWYVSSVPVFMAIMTVPVGIMGARLGLKRVFAAGALLQAAGIFAPLCTSYPQLFLTRVVFAIGTAITVPMASAVVAGWFTSRELPLVNGSLMSFVNLGNSFSYIATIPIAMALSWQAPIMIYGAFALTSAVAWFILGKEPRREPVVLNERSVTTTEKMPELSIKQALRQKSTLIFAFTLLGPFCCMTALNSWLPTYYNEVFNIPLARASSMTAIFPLTGAVACIAGGVLAVKTGRRRPFLIIPGMLMGLVGLCCVSFNVDWIICLSIAAFGIVNNIQSASIFTIPMELPNMTPRTGAVVLAFCLGIGNFGGFLGPLIVGYLTDLTGSFWPGFLICFTMSLSLLIGGLLLPETGPKGRKTETPEATAQALAK